MSDVDQVNQHIREMEANGYRIWSDHPGYTLDLLNEMLKPHKLEVEALDEPATAWLWFRIVEKKP